MTFQTLVDMINANGVVMVLAAFAVAFLSLLYAFRVSIRSRRNRRQLREVMGEMERLKVEMADMEQEVNTIEHQVEEVEEQISHSDHNTKLSGRLETIHKLKEERHRIDDRIDSYLEDSGSAAEDESYFDALYSEARERYDDVKPLLSGDQISLIEGERQKVFDLKAKLFENGLGSPDAAEQSKDYHAAIKHFFVVLRREIVARLSELERQELSA
jgi:predicted nuclease with TOPRIM domain